MPLYMSTFGYKSEVWAGLIRSPENREEAVGRVLEEAGCKLRGLWYAFGAGDGFALIEAPDNKAMAGVAIAIASSGAFRSFETTPLMTQGGDAGGAPVRRRRRVRGARGGRAGLNGGARHR